MNHSLILHYSGRIILPLAMLFSIYLYLRGHNAPGGGFVGGLVAAAGLTVYALPRGSRCLRRLLVLSPPSLAGLGVLCAMASGLPALGLGQSFLTHQWSDHLPALVAGTPVLFDLGVYLVVIGSVLTFLSLYLEP